jgi:small subunit ribosomal protein S13
MIKVYKLFAKFIKQSNYGLGFRKLKLMYKRLGVNIEGKVRYKSLKVVHFIYLYKNERRFIFGKPLRLIYKQARKALRQVNCLRSIRFDFGLPCRGQRTQTNGRTCKMRLGISGKSVRFKDDMDAYNSRRMRRHSKKKKNVKAADKKEREENKRLFGDVKKKKKKRFIYIKKEQKSRIIRNLWARNKRLKRTKKQMKFKSKLLTRKKSIQWR